MLPVASVCLALGWVMLGLQRGRFSSSAWLALKGLPGSGRGNRQTLALLATWDQSWGKMGLRKSGSSQWIREDASRMGIASRTMTDV